MILLVGLCLSSHDLNSAQAAPEPATQTGDVDGDGKRDGFDLLVFGRLWDRDATDAKSRRADLNQDGRVNEKDLFQLLSALNNQ